MKNLQNNVLKMAASNLTKVDHRTYEIVNNDDGMVIAVKLEINSRLIAIMSVTVNGYSFHQEEINDDVREFWAKLGDIEFRVRGKKLDDVRAKAKEVLLAA